MVFIQSQEYTNTFGKKSKNVLCLEGQTDYRISFNSESNKHDVTIVMGDYDKYLFSAETEEQCTRILQNIFTHHATKDPSTITDINSFMINEVEEEVTLEEVEEVIGDVLRLLGYVSLADAWEQTKEESYLEEGHTSPIIITDTNEVAVGRITMREPPKPEIVTGRITEYTHYA